MIYGTIKKYMAKNKLIYFGIFHDLSAYELLESLLYKSSSDLVVALVLLGLYL